VAFGKKICEMRHLMREGREAASMAGERSEQGEDGKHALSMFSAIPTAFMRNQSQAAFWPLALARGVPRSSPRLRSGVRHSNRSTGPI